MRAYLVILPSAVNRPEMVRHEIMYRISDPLPAEFPDFLLDTDTGAVFMMAKPVKITKRSQDEGSVRIWMIS